MAKARFTNANHRLFPNQFVSVNVTFGVLKNACRGAGDRGAPPGEGDFLFVVGADHIAHLRGIRTGPAIGNSIAILEGSGVGEAVVVNGGDTLDEGLKVEIAK
jgi:multidrug efflux system membrane fusion protein